MLTVAACSTTSRPPAAAAHAHSASTDSARRLVAWAISAAGGPAAVAQARTLAWTGEAEVVAGGRTVAITGTWAMRLPDTAVVSTRPRGTPPDAMRHILIASSQGWLSRGGVRTPMPAAMFASERDEFWGYHVLRLSPLRQPDVSVRVATPDSGFAVALEVTAPQRPAVTLHMNGNGVVRRLYIQIADAGGGPPTRQRWDLDGQVNARGVTWFRTLSIAQNDTPYFRLTLREFAVDEPADWSMLRADAPSPP